LKTDNSKSLESFLDTPDDVDIDDTDSINYDLLLADIYKSKDLDLISKPKVYISADDKFFQNIMEAWKKSSNSTKWSVDLVPKYHGKKVDGFFLSFSKKFIG